MKSLKETLAISITMIGMAFVADSWLYGCLTPGQIGADVHAACTLVGVVDPDAGINESICATADELSALAAAAVEAATMARSDGGARKAGQCNRIPNTGTCATETELAYAIAKVKAARK